VGFVLAVSATCVLIVSTPSPAAALSVDAVTMVGSTRNSGSAIATGTDGALWFIDS